MGGFLFVVAAALFDAEGRVLMARRPQGKSLAGLWEFPGGKLAKGERPEEALCRELEEELGIVVAPNDLQPWTFASHPYEEFHLFMPLYACRIWQGLPQSREGQDIGWFTVAEAAALPMPPADIPLVRFWAASACPAGGKLVS